MNILRFVWVLLLTAFMSTGCKPSSPPVSPDGQLIGQKLMLDLRYFCGHNVFAEQCYTPVTELTPELAELIVAANVGGVILFAENLRTTEQIVKFTYDLQQLAKTNDMPPLFIGIDQEGGRVARLKSAIATRFIGNMAIGATYPSHGNPFAQQVNAGIAQELLPLGINVNFAPTVDVNANPHNPVINVRSYGESAAMVAELGVAAVDALQQNGVLSALKHFPGHGDTHIDSHTGLPTVNHTLDVIKHTDLAPFSQAINSTSPPAMIMTAHIQYPALDDTTFTARDGTQTILPATLSRRILTGLLRNQMDYQGLIVTDALDMAGIAHYVDEADAVIKTFQAGADIALMPFSIRTYQDIEEFWQLQQRVVAALQTGELDRAEMQSSLGRILSAKQQFDLAAYTEQPLAKRQSYAMQNLPLQANKQIEQRLAEQALTLLADHSTKLPLMPQGNWLALMPDAARCKAFEHALTSHAPEVTLVCVSAAAIHPESKLPSLIDVNTVIVGDVTPQYSMAEMGGMDDLTRYQRANKANQYDYINRLFGEAAQYPITKVFVALRAPYITEQFAKDFDVAIATYNYDVTISENSATGVSFDALVQGLLGTIPMQGISPVSVALE